MSRERKRIAVIGSGAAGLSAAWLLSRSHDVVLYEREPRLGGHANTAEVMLPEGPIAVDTGFIVFNRPSYPNFDALLSHLGVETHESHMSFTASLDGGRFEYSGTRGLIGLFDHGLHVARPRSWRIFRDILRLYRSVGSMSEDARWHDRTLGEYLDSFGYSESFRKDHLLPMCAAIWSCPPAEMHSYQLRAFVRFFENHGLFKLARRPRWRTVTGGSREYVRALAREFSGEIRLSARIRSVTRNPVGVQVTTADGSIERFNDVVFACHPDETLEMLADPTLEERGLLGAFRFQPNTAVLHSDPALMPRRRRLWSAWNYLEMDQADEHSVSVTYWMNRLQGLRTETPLFVSLNPSKAPNEELVHAKYQYDHPIFDGAALKAQNEFGAIQGNRQTWHCGAWLAYGFHEDAIQSGLAVAEALGGVSRPWHLTDPNGRIPWVNQPADQRSETGRLAA